MIWSLLKVFRQLCIIQESSSLFLCSFPFLTPIMFENRTNLLKQPLNFTIEKICTKLHKVSPKYSGLDFLSPEKSLKNVLSFTLSRVKVNFYLSTPQIFLNKLYMLNSQLHLNFLKFFFICLFLFIFLFHFSPLKIFCLFLFFSFYFFHDSNYPLDVTWQTGFQRTLNKSFDLRMTLR